MIRLSVVVLLLANAGLATTLAWELNAFGFEDAGPEPAQRRTQVARPHRATPDHTAQWVATILARPLFSPTRRPPPAAAKATDRAAAPGLPRLSGVLVGPFGRSAIFAGDNGKPLVVDEGAHVNAWIIRSIQADAVKIDGPGGARLLHPKFQAAPASPMITPGDSGRRIGWSRPR